MEKRPGEFDIVTDRLAMETLLAVPDTDASPYRFVHCAKCVGEMPGYVKGPRYWMRFEIGLTPTGLLIRCVRHDMPVAHLTPRALNAIVEARPPCGHYGCDHDHG
jgi:hypothetical protein